MARAIGDRIDAAAIREGWDEALRAGVSIVDRLVVPSTLLKTNTLSRALREVGRNGRTLFMIILCNTIYLSRVVDSLWAEGQNMPDHIIRHVSRQIGEHINLTDIYDWRGAAQQKGTFRPLRAGQGTLGGAGGGG